MTILDYYKEICFDKELNEIYYSTGDTQLEGRGKIFSFFNTNYRTLFDKRGDKYTGFGTGFSAIDNVVGKPYNEWQRYEINNENMFKHHTVRMRKSDLFSVKNGIYNRTKRGDVFKRMMVTPEDKLSLNEKRFLCYVLILAGHFSNTKNYIFRRTEEAFSCFKKSGYYEEEILELQKEFITNSINKNKYDVLKMDYPYLHSFCFQYKEIDFNKLYKDSSTLDKNELHNYVLNNLNASNRECILSHKFEDGGNYTVKMMQDSAMILYLTKKIINKKCTDFDSFIYGLFGFYSELYNVNKSMLYQFIADKNNNSVFRRIFDILYDVSQDVAVADLDVRCINIDDKGDFDTTDESGAKENEAFSEALKKLVKINSNYKCIMEDIENCKYFNSKESNQHYLEIHHFIPRAFSNDFDNSIEIKDNYVPLCPNCHRKIHLAVDSERKHLINYIYSKRKDKLKENGLIPEDERIDNKDFLNILYEYYNVTE